MKRISDSNTEDDINSLEITKPDCASNTSICDAMASSNRVNQRLRNFEPTWHPLTPDLTQCRSLWLNNLEVRVNQRDSSLISIANDLSEVNKTQINSRRSTTV